jgi:hypothetical protein
MTIRSTGVLIAMLAGPGLGAACTLASPMNVSVEPDTAAGDGGAGGPLVASGAGGATASGASCSGAFAKPDVSKLTACGGGKGHCYDKDKNPMPTAYNACPDATQLCVPDQVLTAGGNPMKSCTSVVGKGGCIDPALFVMPDEYKSQMSMLKQDVCDSGELCVPCNDPMHGNAPTPFCQPMGVYDQPCTGGGAPSGGDGGAPSSTETCCASSGKPAGICMTQDAVPESGRGKTDQDTCKSGEQCVPQAFMGTPTKCSARFGAAGICIDQCFSTIFALAGPLVGNDGCGDSEVCMPCSLMSMTGSSVPGCN